MLKVEMEVNKMRHDLMATANALAVTVGVTYVLCAVLVTLLPEASMAVAQSWFHGIDIARISSWNVTVGSFIMGLVTSIVFAWAVGYLFAYIYNMFAKK